MMRKEDENLEKCIITGMAEGTRGRGRPRRAWSDDVKKWTSDDQSHYVVPLLLIDLNQIYQQKSMKRHYILRLLTRDRAAWRSVLVHHAPNVRSSE